MILPAYLVVICEVGKWNNMHKQRAVSGIPGGNTLHIWRQLGLSVQRLPLLDFVDHLPHVHLYFPVIFCPAIETQTRSLIDEAKTGGYTDCHRQSEDRWEGTLAGKGRRVAFSGQHEEGTQSCSSCSHTPVRRPCIPESSSDVPVECPVSTFYPFRSPYVNRIAQDRVRQRTGLCQ